jgi:hypothetical protein
MRAYLSLILLFVPAVLFISLSFIFWNHPLVALDKQIHWQFIAIGICGIIATSGGVLDWQYHRNPLNMKIPKKERDAEAVALGLGGLPMFVLMWLAMVTQYKSALLIPIILVLI